ncbi:hypothetical protein AtDm6_0691 [Acetobacter tropicalis]|uniref:Uncharacterized protein n=1 Tax=Acetobacter tropicalis TaxID=104102 RepID=A0A094ZTP8_9PROT|nr:hypothetical protein AtDm6_0691 [Acetobacter tropicalis]
MSRQKRYPSLFYKTVRFHAEISGAIPSATPQKPASKAMK